MTGKAIYALLTANATITAACSTRIFPVMATQDAAYPFLVYQIDGTLPTDTKDGTSPLDVVSAKVLTFATTYTQASDLAEAARTALDRKSGTYGTVAVQSIRFADQRASEMDFDKHIFIIEQDYQVRLPRAR